MRIISRADWGADPESLPDPGMHLPANEVFLHHSVTSVSSDPAVDMRTIEHIGMQRFGQFSYSYVIHPHDGEILEGAGLKRGAHTARRNSSAFGICWVGNYDERQPKVQQIEATRWLIAQLTQEGHLRPSAPVRGHRDVAATACPGRHLYAVLDVLRRPWEEPKGEWPVLNHPPTCIVARPQGDGYWIVTHDGGVFAFGQAPPLTAIGGEPVERIISADAWPDGEGLICLGDDGGVFALGSARYEGRVEWRGG